MITFSWSSESRVGMSGQFVNSVPITLLIALIKEQEKILPFFNPSLSLPCFSKCFIHFINIVIVIIKIIKTKISTIF